MRLPLCVASMTLLAFGLVVSAQAQEAFTVTGTGISGSGTITLGPSSYADASDITAITGDFSVSTAGANFSGPISGLILPVSYSPTSPSSSSLVVYDDLFYSNSDAPVCNGGLAGGLLDACGVFFNVTDTATGNTVQVNVYGNGGGPGGYLELDDNGTVYGDENVTVDFTPTPEPSSIALLGTGLLGFAGMIKRRIRR